MDGGSDGSVVGCVVKLRQPWDEGSEKKMLKSLHKIKGVRTAEIDDGGNVHVHGDAVEVAAVFRKLKKLQVVESPDHHNNNGAGGNKEDGNVERRRGLLKSLFRRKEKTNVDGDHRGKAVGRKRLLLFWCLCFGIILLVVVLTV